MKTKQRKKKERKKREERREKREREGKKRRRDETETFGGYLYLGRCANKRS